MSFPGVMLASPMSTIARTQEQAVQTLAGQPGWTHELKIDGVRALITISDDIDGRVRIINRRGADITWRYPDVVADLAGFSESHPLTVDGELLCVVDGAIDFPAIHRRDAQGTRRNAALLAPSLPARFWAFDLLDTNGHDLRSLRQDKRRWALEQTGLEVVPSSPDLPALWAIVRERGLEGVVSKRTNSTYVPRRSHTWVKIKQQHTVTCVVLDIIRKGTSWDVSALRVGVFDGAEFRDIGRVGSGFTNADLTAMQIWEPGHIVEVGYLDVSPHGMLRQPVYLRTRTDVDISACTIDQLNTKLTRQDKPS